MGSKHTPGPWSVKNDYDERHIVIANIDGEIFPDGTTSYSYDFVCDTYGGDYESASCDVANANARLIAAAPDMLEVLKEIRAIIADGALIGFQPLEGDWAERLYRSQAKSSAAVKKAEGRS